MTTDLNTIAKDILKLIGDEDITYALEENNFSWGALKDCTDNIVLYKGSDAIWYFSGVFLQDKSATKRSANRYLEDIAHREAFASSQAAKKAKRKPRKKVSKNA